MEPPACVQNAMLKQDKKPFTYTPGGINLAEIKSPRMARRIERNANYTGQPDVPASPNNFRPTQPLPPSALAAMQPQIQVQVFPTGPPPNRAQPPPPPPPPPSGVPPPPPLPTQKIQTGDNQVLERPDMTKIIPDNPMALLRKTGGPAVRPPSMVDEVKVAPNPARYQPQPVAAPPPPIQTSSVNIGSLYIPPVRQASVASPPAVPKRESPAQSPGTPTLKEAPRPWQKQQANKQAEEMPPWAKRDVSSPVAPHGHVPAAANVEEMPSWPKRNVSSSPVVPPAAEEVASWPKRNVTASTPPAVAPNAVYVTQPVVLQHPGNHVAAEGRGPIARQMSGGGWNPAQSNAFKVIQKITRTEDGDKEEEGGGGGFVVTEHGPKYTQQYQQQDRELVNRFRQGLGDDSSLHNEVDPRYRGAAIPSKAFKLLQSMTDGSDSPTVSKGSPGNRSPQVRNIPIQIERDEAPRNYVHPSEQTVPEPKKYTGSAIPSRSFRMLQAMTAPDNCANANDANENYDPSSYYPPYYDYYYYPPPPPYQGEERAPTPAPYWGYYPPPPSPYHFNAPPDPNSEHATPPYWEMGQYPYPPPYWDPYYYYYGYQPPYYNNGADTIAQKDEIAPKIEVSEQITSKQDEDSSSSDDEGSDSETEVEEDDCIKKTGSLPAIKSVKDISIYNNTESDNESEEDDDSSSIDDDEVIPHQLSVIFEESEKSALSDTTTIQSDDDESPTTVSVKLPLKISFTNLNNSYGELATVTVGNEERNTDEIYASFTLKSPKVEVEPLPGDDDDDGEDWWGVLAKDDDVMPVKKGEVRASTPPVAEIDDDDDASSTSSSDSSLVASTKASADDEEVDVNNNEELDRPLSIKERIAALKNSISAKRAAPLRQEELKSSVRDKVQRIEVTSSIKSFDSEEEGDSGVTSDMSRHISDTEEFPELRKMTRYQRAATHSRLFKLLQEECEDDDDEEEGTRREQLTLPLQKADASLLGAVNERLVTELVQSVLQKTKGQSLRDLPKEKLQAAAKRILLEEVDDACSPDSCFLSPLRASTESSTPAMTPQEFYNDYKQYYESWGTHECDILPSKAFRLLQEHSGLNKTGAIAGLLAKCPKVLSAKNIFKLLNSNPDSSCLSSPSPDPNSSNDVTSAS